MYINTGRWTEDGLNGIIREGAGIADPGERIAFISGQFLGIPYQSNTLIGDAAADEELIINLSGMDCFTFLDYVEAMRLSGSYSDFGEVLKRVRYRDGMVAFRSRNHFFTDWAEYRSGHVRDVTGELGHIVKNEKMLNLKQDGLLYVEGIKPYGRRISYLTLSSVSLDDLKTGDYAGIYSEKAGLDVSHVGIIIKREGVLLFRHASSDSNVLKVIDEDLAGYISEKPGLIVLRPL